MKKLFLISILTALLLCAVACKKQAPQEEVPAHIAAGYREAGTVLTGGGTQADAGDFNAKALELGTERFGDEALTTLRFTFVSGSRMSGSEAESPGCGVPQYTVFAYDNPARLAVQFEQLAYWDYRHGLALDSALLRGTFQQSIFGSPKITVYFQLTQPAYYLAEESGDTLTIRLLPKADTPAPAGTPADTPVSAALYYVTANAYDAYKAGTISLEFDASPTLAADLQNILLISPPMQTQEEAEAYRAGALQLYPSIPEAVWRVHALPAQQLPPYDSVLDYLTAFETPAVRLPDGGLRTLPVLVPDGLYLCDMPGGEGYLYSKELPADEAGDVYQQLMLQRYGSAAPAPLAFDFAAIEQAQYSPDGRKLAVLENSDSGAHLYVFDADTQELLNDLSEMGFGNNTSAFLWNSLGTTIYAITGISGMQLHQFDYSIPDESKRASLVDNYSVEEGSLAYCDGELYFIDATVEDGSRIYRIKPEGGVRKPFLPGSRFGISPDEQYIAIINSRETSGAQAQAGLSLYHRDTGESTLITSDFYPYECIWSLDSTKLYYIESRISGGQTEVDTSTDPDAGADPDVPPDTGASVPSAEDPYPFTLWVYDIATGTSTLLMDLSATELYATATPGMLYLNRFETDIGGTLLRTAYVLDLETVFQQAPPDTPEEQAETAPGEGGGQDALQLE